MEKVPLSGWFGILLAGAALLQGGVGLVNAVGALRMCREGGEAAGNMPYIGVQRDLRVRKKLWAKLSLIKKLARAAEAASMFYTMRVLKELSSELEGNIVA